jgi:hypothetical protein
MHHTLKQETIEMMRLQDPQKAARSIESSNLPDRGAVGSCWHVTLQVLRSSETVEMDAVAQGPHLLASRCWCTFIIHTWYAARYGMGPLELLTHTHTPSCVGSDRIQHRAPPPPVVWGFPALSRHARTIDHQRFGIVILCCMCRKPNQTDPEQEILPACMHAGQHV